MVQKSFSYKETTFDDFSTLMKQVANPTNDENGWKYSHIWYDPDTKEFGKRKRARQAYMQNIGTIPDTTAIEVVLEGFRTRIGQITERFAEKLTESDIFILSGRTFQFLRSAGNKIIVREEYGRVPTVPSWTGEAQTRTGAVSEEVSKIISNVGALLETKRNEDAIEWLTLNYPVGIVEAQSIVNYVIEQLSITPLPTLSRIIIETYNDPSGAFNIIVLSLYGREVNSVLSQALAAKLSKEINANLSIINTDNGFLLRFPPGVEIPHHDLFARISEDELESVLSQSIVQTELFKTRFRHVTGRSLMILKRNGSIKVSISQQQRLAHWLMNSLSHNYPAITETIREILHDTYNLPSAKIVLKKIATGDIDTLYAPPGEIPSPMTHDIILNGNIDIVQLEDRRTLLLSLHKQVLSRILPEVGKYESLLPKIIAKEFFQARLQYKPGQDMAKLVHNFAEFTKVNDDFISDCSETTGIPKSDITTIIPSLSDIVALPDYNDYTTLELLPYYGSTKPMEYWDQFSKNDHNISVAIELSKEISPELGWEELFSHYLKYAGPQSDQTIANELKIPIEKVKEVLDRMQRKNILLRGNFTGFQSFIRKIDRDAILSQNRSSTQVNENQIKKYREWKMRLSPQSQSSKLFTVDYLAENGPSRDLIELVARLPSFDWQELRKALLDREVYFGRFLGRRLVFMHHHHIEHFQQVSRSTEPLSKLAMEIFALISEIPGISQREISHTLKEKQSRIHNALNFLEHELYIARTGWELSISHGGSPQIRYISLPSITINEHNFTDACENIIQLCCKWYGPLTIDDLLRITRLPYPIIEATLISLEGVLVSEVFFSYIYYGYREDFDKITEIQVGEPDERDVYLLSPYDPYFYTHGGSYQVQLLPRRTRFTVVHGGASIGHIEVAIPDGDVLQVLNIQLRRRSLRNLLLIASLGQKLLDIAHRAFHTRAVFIEEILYKSANHVDNRLVVSILSEVGYTLNIDHLVAGVQKLGSYQQHDVMETKLLNLRKIKSKRYLDVNSLFSNMPVISVSEALNQLSIPIRDARLLLLNALRKGQIHHKVNILYRDDFWNTLEPQCTDVDANILENLEQASSLNQLSRKLDRPLELLSTQIQEAVSSGCVELITPFGSINEYRRFNTEGSHYSQKIQKLWIQYIIDLHGPLTYSKIYALTNTYISISRIEILIVLAQLFESKTLFSSTLRVDKKSELVYYNKSQQTLLQDPARKRALPKWIIFDKFAFDISEQVKQNTTHVVIFEGVLIASLHLAFSSDEAIIENLIFDDILLQKDQQVIQELFTKIEAYLFSKGIQSVRIKRINSIFPEYWLETHQADAGV
ncbi:MAG: hypothetical protein ACXAB7_16930 [Candidatus Kariarchaeaceae archaeon]